MNRPAMPAPAVRRRLVHCLTACLGLAVLAGCGGARESAADAPLAGAAIGGAFELVDANGKTVRWDDFDGRYRVIYFGYAFCPDVCPLDVQRMMAGYGQFKASEPELAAQVQPLFVTIDPTRDTPEVVGQFTRAFSDDLIGLTGTQAQVDAAAKAFAVYHAKGQTGPDGKGYLMDHSRAAYLMGRQGEPIALLPVEQDAEAVAAELARWVS
jgi:protein SCO1